MQTLKTILQQLVEYQSITPHDAGCQDYMINYLEQLGFQCQRFDNPPVSNFFAWIGQQKPLLVFAGHTDVVPPGSLSSWHSNPFVLTERYNQLYGRGVADMKGSLAAMMVAAERFLAQHPTFSGSLGFLITSGEEGDHFELGTPFVMEQLKRLQKIPDYCIVGEPSSTHRVGDVIKIGRRGSLSAKVVLQGKQGHVAYPHLADNPIHRISPALAQLVNTQWDQGNLYFPPTTLQITRIQAGGEIGNVIPGELMLAFNLRYSPEVTAQHLQERIADCFTQHHLTTQIEWLHNGSPFLTDKGQLLEYVQQVILQHTGTLPELSTSGGTSDGRFIAPYGVEIVELGPVNATIHQANECVSLSELETLTTIYHSLCEALLTAPS